MHPQASGVASAKRAFPRPSWQRIAVIGGCVVIFLIAFAAAAHGAIEKMVVERALSGAFGGDTTIANLRREDGLTILEGVSIQTATGSASFTADRVAYAVNRDAWDVRPTGLHVTIAVDRWSGNELNGAPSAAHLLGLGHLQLHLTNAAISFVRSTGAAKLEVAGLNGTLDAAARLTYDLRGSVIGDTAYPFSVSAIDDGQSVDQHWSAVALPVAPISAIFADSGLAFSEGEAHNVTFTSAGGLHGTFTLDGVRGSIEGHALHALTGNVTIGPDGQGSAGLDAVLDDGTPGAGRSAKCMTVVTGGASPVRGRAICARSHACSG